MTPFTSSIRLLCLLSLAIGCHTVPKETPKTALKPNATASKKASLAKEGIKSPTSFVNEPAPPKPVAAQQNLNELFNHLADPTLPVPDSELFEAAKLGNSLEGSLEQATFIAGQLRGLKLKLEQGVGFQEQDVTNSEVSSGSSTKPRAISLEQTFRDQNIDLTQIITRNQHLNNSGIYSTLQDLLERTQNSEIFYQRMTNILNSKEPQVAAVNPITPPIENAQAVPQPTPKESGISQAPSIEYVESSEVKTALSELKKSDTALMQAQRLADKGEYRQAIDQVEKVDRSDPFYDLAKEKIKSFSNLAVQDLRKKAAEAFQNAMPIQEPRAKLSYLYQAKDLLEKAIKDYPVADQLDRVRENLEVIKRDVENLEGSNRLQPRNQE